MHSLGHLNRPRWNSLQFWPEGTGFFFFFFYSNRPFSLLHMWPTSWLNSILFGQSSKSTRRTTWTLRKPFFFFLKLRVIWVNMTRATSSARWKLLTYFKYELDMGWSSVHGPCSWPHLTRLLNICYGPMHLSATMLKGLRHLRLKYG